MQPQINRDTQLCVSLSARPSNIGTRFHNHLYSQLGLNFIYKAFSPVNLTNAILGIRGLPIRGAAISMPFKSEVIPLLDEIHPTADAIGSVNTIVNQAGHLVGYNTDYIAVLNLLREHLDSSKTVTVLGSGGMAKAVVAAAVELGHEVTVVGRNKETGQRLADQYRASFSSSYLGSDVVINATPIGMAGGDLTETPIPADALEEVSLVFDVVAMPVETALVRASRKLNKSVITGRQVMTLQAVEQFHLYTNIMPTKNQILAAETFAHSE